MHIYFFKYFLKLFLAPYIFKILRFQLHHIEIPTTLQLLSLLKSTMWRISYINLIRAYVGMLRALGQSERNANSFSESGFKLTACEHPSHRGLGKKLQSVNCCEILDERQYEVIYLCSVLKVVLLWNKFAVPLWEGNLFMQLFLLVLYIVAGLPTFAHTRTPWTTPISDCFS